jgi:hypothetical protein
VANIYLDSAPEPGAIIEQAVLLAQAQISVGYSAAFDIINFNNYLDNYKWGNKFLPGALVHGALGFQYY